MPRLKAPTSETNDRMLTVQQAIARINDSLSPLDTTTVPLSESRGLTLAADVVSSLDSPPFDKALMDGFAVRSDDCSGATTLNVVEEVTAGRVAEKTVQAGQAIQIMTGAPLPNGADAVVQIELTKLDGNKVTIEPSVPLGANILTQGASIQNGAIVLRQGTTIRPQEIGLLAELGCHSILVRRRPRIAILATGDELVPINEEPGPGQIRNSNESMLAAQVENAGGIPVPLGVARDEVEHLALGISLGLQADMLILSGGVSAGKLDLVPSELSKAGVEKVFHKVQVKPGKPVWFGVAGADNKSIPVFGLPGNPVSSMVCFELFVRTAIRKLVQARQHTTVHTLPLAKEAAPNVARPTYHPARLVDGDAGTRVQLVDWVGSADLCCTVDATGMALIPMGQSPLPAGESVRYFPW
jgi:molybdopterin molybdotransferase